MTEKKNLKININDIKFGQVTSSSYKLDVNSVICESHKPTSAELKCSLQSNIHDLKLVSDISFPFASLNLAGFSTEIHFKLDQEYSFTNNYLFNTGFAFISRTLQFNAKSYWKLYDNSIEDHDFSSTVINNRNSVETIIPASSCFNLTMVNNIGTITLGYDAIAKMIVYDNSIPVSGPELQSLANGITSSSIIADIQITTPISGSIIFNIVRDHSELTPCD